MENISRNGLSFILFDIVLEEVVSITTTGSISKKSIQLLIYADDIDLISRTK